jgi:FAD synthase
MNELVFGEVFKGLGMSAKLGWPTINIKNESKTDAGLYIVCHKKFGRGHAQITPDAAEIHFFKEIEFFDQYLKCEIVNKIGPPNKGFYKNNLSPTDIYYAGVKYIEQLTDKSPETIRKSIYK